MVQDKAEEIKLWSEECLYSFVSHRDGLTRAIVRKRTQA